MDAYKIGVSIILNNSMTPGLTAITAQLLGMNNTVNLLNGNLARLKLAGAAGILGGVMIFKGMAKLAEHGAEVNHQLELMKIAGMTNGEIQASMAQSMKTSGNVMTTTLSENLAHVRELRYAFGDTSKAMEHLDTVSKANSVLNSIKGGGHDQVWELVKALENKGLTADPKSFESYINTMTKVTEATGGKVTPANFMSTFKYGRTAMLGWDEDFIGGALPRSIQSMTTGGGGAGGGGGPGNALMSAFAKVVQGQMPKNAAEEFDRMGLAPGGAQHIKGSSDAQVAGGIAGRDQFIANPYEWVQRTLMPALAAKGVTSQNDIIAQISKMFPVRTASQLIGEYALQGRFHEGENSPFEKDIGQSKGAMDLSMSFPELMKNDYPTVMKAFHQQFKLLLEVLGMPLVAPGGPVLRAMAGITSAINAMSQFATAHPEGMAAALSVLASGAVALLVGGIVALGAAVLAVGGVPAVLIALAAGIAAFAFLGKSGPKDTGTNAPPSNLQQGVDAANKANGTGPTDTTGIADNMINSWTRLRAAMLDFNPMLDRTAASIRQWAVGMAASIRQWGVGMDTSISQWAVGMGARVVASIRSEAERAIAGVASAFDGLGAAIWAAIKSAVSLKGFSMPDTSGGVNKGGASGTWGGTTQKQGYNAAPPPTSGGVQHASIMMNHRVVGELVMAEIVSQASGPTQGASWSDSSRAYPSNDTYSLTA
jgi:hypothetical protein